MKTPLAACGIAAALFFDVSAAETCTTGAIAGEWVFATNVGRQMLGEPFPPDRDITAIGTMQIDRHGNLSGVFDVTVEQFGFIPDIAYSGSVVLNDDCRGTLEFVTASHRQATGERQAQGQGRRQGLSRALLRTASSPDGSSAAWRSGAGSRRCPSRP